MPFWRQKNRFAPILLSASHLLLPELCSLQQCFLREQHNTGQNANARAQCHRNVELCNERTLTEQDAAQPFKHTARDRQNRDPQASTNDSLPRRRFCPSEFLIKSLSYLCFHFTSKRRSCQETAHKRLPDPLAEPRQVWKYGSGLFAVCCIILTVPAPPDSGTPQARLLHHPKQRL